MHDPSKAVLPNASIVVTDVATNLAVTVVTDERGGYVVTPLNPGVYRVTVTSPGFQTTVVNSVEVQIGQSARVNVELSLGTVTENTVVTSDTPLLDTESGTLGHVVTISGDRANTGVGGQRPDRLGSGVLDEPTVARWFDTTAFAVPAQFTYGNSGGNILREDSYKTLDVSLFKQFRLSDEHGLQFRVEAFNVTNTPSFSAPSTAIDTATGGRVTSTSGPPRQLQFAIKYTF